MILKKTSIKILLILTGVLFTSVLAFVIYTLDYYRTEPFCDSAYDDILVVENRQYITYGDPDSTIGIIFYQGGKVDEHAYDLFLLKLAANDVFVVSIKMPFNLAVFGSNRALQVIETFVEIDQWYLMGHSLGGAMASAFAAKHPDILEGIILLSAYASSDLSSFELEMLSIYGDRDGVLSMDQVNETKTNNPSNTTYVIIEGGNHSGFANYGEQKGDLDAEITPFVQQNQTVLAIIQFITGV